MTEQLEMHIKGCKVREVTFGFTVSLAASDDDDEDADLEREEEDS
jgi:hypothetical protein